jgi:hypothetical protein
MALFLSHDFNSEYSYFLQRSETCRSARANMLDPATVNASFGVRGVTKAEQESSPTGQVLFTTGYQNRCFAFDHCLCSRNQDRAGISLCEARPSQPYRGLHTHEFQSASLEGVLNFL